MTGVPNEKVVAGLSCGQVLAKLSDYLDEDLPAAEREMVEGHLRGCEGCARFGGEFKATVRALKEHLARGPSLSPDLRARLARSLDDA
jgi:anti-sigma factor RsiW